MYDFNISKQNARYKQFISCIMFSKTMTRLKYFFWFILYIIYIIYIYINFCLLYLHLTRCNSNGVIRMTICEDETWKIIAVLTTHFPSRRDKTARFHRTCTSRATSSAPSFPVSFPYLRVGRNRKIHESPYVICHVRSGFAHRTVPRVGETRYQSCNARRYCETPVAQTPNELFRSRARSPELFPLRRFIVLDRCNSRRDVGPIFNEIYAFCKVDFFLNRILLSIFLATSSFTLN